MHEGDPFHHRPGAAPVLSLTDGFDVAAVLALTTEEKEALMTTHGYFCVAFRSTTHQAWVIPTIPDALLRRFFPCETVRNVFHVADQGNPGAFAAAAESPLASGHVALTRGRLEINRGGNFTAKHHLCGPPERYSCAAVRIWYPDDAHYAYDKVYEVLEWWDFKAFEWHDARGKPHVRRSEPLLAAPTK
jgi:hypothetical protein